MRAGGLGCRSIWLQRQLGVGVGQAKTGCLAPKDPFPGSRGRKPLVSSWATGPLGLD